MANESDRAAMLRMRAAELAERAKADPARNRQKYFSGLASAYRAQADLLARQPGDRTEADSKTRRE